MVARTRKHRCVAFIADVVRSRALQGRRRARLQDRLAATLDEINARYRAAILAKGLIRAREFENRDFAEYFIMGSLASTAVALAVGVMLRVAVVGLWRL